MIKIRKAVKEDSNTIFDLVMELAIYEKAPEEVTNTIQKIQEEGFGEDPAFGCILAEYEDQVIGMSLYYFRYSTWKGRRLYLEDLIVKEKYRGIGAGKILFDETIIIAKEENCSGMMWQVLDWNEPSINFYKRYGTRFDDEWLNCHLNF